MAQPTETEYMRMADDEYKGNYYVNTKDKPYTVIDSTHGTDYENQGLQASVVVGNDANGNPDPNQKVVVIRGSEPFGDPEGNKDWGQDLGLNDSQAYKKDSQFKDAVDYVESQIAAGNISVEDIQSGKVTFTGHSLGGAVASYLAEKYGGEATVFSAPSAYNMLNPEERKNLGKDSKIKNLYVVGDSIAKVPKGVPVLGEQILIENSLGIYKQKSGKLGIGGALKFGFDSVVGFAGHFRENFARSADGKTFVRAGSGVDIFYDIFSGRKSIISIAGGLGVTLRQRISFGRFINSTLNSIKDELTSFLSNPIKSISKGFQTNISKTIELLDNFLGSKRQLIDTIPTLKQAKKINDNLHPKMQEIFSEAVILASAITGVPAYQVEAFGYQMRLDPDHNINLGAVKETSRFFDKEIDQITEIAEKVEIAFNDFHGTDNRTANSFNQKG